MKVLKYDYEKHETTVVDIPEDRKILPLLTFNMDDPMNCINCGKPMTYGDGYTSKRYFTENGFGFYECKACYFGEKDD